MSSLLEEKLGGKQGENRNVKRTMLDKKTKTERFSELERRNAMMPRYSKSGLLKTEKEERLS